MGIKLNNCADYASGIWNMDYFAICNDLLNIVWDVLNYNFYGNMYYHLF